MSRSERNTVEVWLYISMGLDSTSQKRVPNVQSSRPCGDVGPVSVKLNRMHKSSLNVRLTNEGSRVPDGEICFIVPVWQTCIFGGMSSESDIQHHPGPDSVFWLRLLNACSGRLLEICASEVIELDRTNRAQT